MKQASWLLFLMGAVLGYEIKLSIDALRRAQQATVIAAVKDQLSEVQQDRVRLRMQNQQLVSQLVNEPAAEVIYQAAHTNYQYFLVKDETNIIKVLEYTR